MEEVISFLLSPFRLVAWILSLPVRGFTFAITKLSPAYDPESVTCPGCGFSGDEGTGGKSCRIKHVRVDSAEVAMNQHICFRCSAEFYTKLFVPAKNWIK